MPEVFEHVVVSALTGEVSVVPFSDEEIAAALAERETNYAAVAVPSVVSARQARLAILQGGILASVEAMIATQDEATRITWEYATEFRRDDPLLTQLAQNLGLSEAQIDQFFLRASTL